MSTLSFTSALKYAFGLFLGFTGFVPYEQTGLSPEDSLTSKPTIEIIITDTTPSYLKANGIPDYLLGDQKLFCLEMPNK